MPPYPAASRPILALAPTASYSSDLSASGDFAVTLPDTVAVLPVSSGRAETEVAYADPADFAASSFAGPEPSSAVAAQPVALMPRTRPLAVVEGGDEDLNRLIEKYATLYEVPVQLVRRVVKRESNFLSRRLQSRPLGPDADQARDGARHGL